jgi:hypothetical protein
MASSAWLTSAIAVADTATQSLGLQEDVQHEAFINGDGLGDADYAPPVPLAAVVERKPGQRRKPGGQELSFRATVAFGRPVSIDPRDIITLSDGFTGPIVDVDGGPRLDGSKPVVTTAYIG